MLGVTLAIQALVAMAVMAVPAMAPAMAQALSLPATLVGAFIAVVYIGAMAGSMSAGPLVRRFGAVRVSQAGLLGCAFGLGLMAAFPNLPGTIAGAFFCGLGYGPITPASSHLLARSAPAGRVALVFSLKQTGVPLGGVMAGALVPPLVVLGGVATALWAVAAGCVACIALGQPLRAALDADREPGHRISFTSLFGAIRLVATSPPLLRLALMSFVFASMQTALSGFLVTFLNTSLEYSLLAAGAALSVAQVGGVVGRVLWGYLADRWLGATRTLVVLALLMATCATAVAVMQAGLPGGLVLALLVVFGASAVGWNGVYLAEVARSAPPGMASVATGGTLGFTFLGNVLGPLMFSALSGAFGTLRAGYLAMAIPAAVCGWVLVRGLRR